MPLDGGGDEDDEGPGRAADLEAAAAEERDDEAGDDRRVEAAVRRRPGRDGDRHGQRQGDDGDGQPGEGIGLEFPGRVALAEHRHELRRVELDEGRLGSGEANGRRHGPDLQRADRGMSMRRIAVRHCGRRGSVSMIAPATQGSSNAEGDTNPQIRGTRGHVLRGRGGRAAGTGRGAAAAHGRRGQLHRHLLPQRALPGERSPVRARQRRRRRGGRGRGGGHRGQARRPRRLRHRPRQLLGGAHHPGAGAGEDPGRHLRRDRRRHDAEGHDLAVSPAPHLQGEARGHDPVPCGGRRRRADRLPLGEASRRHRDRHRRLRGEGEARQGQRLRSRHPVPEGGFRRPREGDHGRAPAATSSTTASARRRSRPRSTA